MTDHLTAVLEHLGFEGRPQQRALYEHLIGATQSGVVVQAGTGTGKSIGVLAAAATHVERAQARLEPAEDGYRPKTPALVVAPTNILLDQYVEKDGPAVAAALGLVVRGLKGRQHYVCDAAPAFQSAPGRDVPVDATRAAHRTHRPGGLEPLEAPTAWKKWLGCPGKDDHDKMTICDYETAKMLLADADIIITNAHIMVIDRRLKSQDPMEKVVEVKDEDGRPILDEDGQPETIVEVVDPPRILPDYCALFVDEAHTFEDVMRGFTTSSIPLATAASMGEEGRGVASIIQRFNDDAFRTSRFKPDPHEVVPDVTLASALQQMGTWRPERGKRKGQSHKIAAAESAASMFDAGASGAFVDRHAVLWFDPAEAPKQPRLVATQINLSSMGRAVLTAVPFGLVSATIPKTMTACLGVREATYADVGHPFDYARQASIGFSRHSGAYKVAQDRANLEARADEVDRLVRMAGGGALLLFSAFRDLGRVYDLIGPGLQRDGFRVLRQQRDDDKAYLGRAFKEDGNAVLFGSESFATGFDVPGQALRLTIVWKLPYPGLDPVTRAIMDSNRDRYEDIMLVKVAQAAGRLIRTKDDVGVVHIADSRAERLVTSSDPMLAHLRDFRRWDIAAAV